MSAAVREAIEWIAFILFAFGFLVVMGIVG
jgi:hypothetical protein